MESSLNKSEGMNQPYHTLKVHQRLGLWLLACLVQVWQKTLRFEYREEDLQMLSRKGEPILLLMWHNQLFSILELQSRFRRKANPLHALVSASKDGALLASFLEFLGVQPVRGSSSRRGATAVRELIGVLKNGGDIAITVDGPRGPIYKAQPGGAMLAILSRQPVFLISCVSRRHWRLKSWDRFYLPVPFSKVEIKLKTFPTYESFGVGRDRDAVQAFIEEELNQLHEDHL